MANVGLHLITIELTHECNLKCIHCYNDSSYEKVDINLSNNADIKIIKNELEKIRPECIILSGGEPLLLGEKFFDIARIIKKYSNKLILATNGQLIRKFPAENYCIFDHIQISLDGPKKIHEEIRGKDTFDEIIKASKYLKNIGVPVSLLMTVHSLNKDYFIDCYKIAENLGIQFGAERMGSEGRGKHVKPISSNEWKKILKFITERHMGINDPLSFMFKDELKNKVTSHKITGGCTAGIATLAITPTLDVLPCIRLRIPIGNLKYKSIEDIWFNSDILKMLRKRSEYKGKCGICYYRNLCGGCRADAFAETGDYLESDPICWIEG